MNNFFKLKECFVFPRFSMDVINSSNVYCFIAMIYEVFTLKRYKQYRKLTTIKKAWNFYKMKYYLLKNLEIVLYESKNL